MVKRYEAELITRAYHFGGTIQFDEDPDGEWVKFEDHEALAQKLADSPCPVCKGKQVIIDESVLVRNGMQLPKKRTRCPHCGTFPKPRRGYFAIDAEDALRRTG
jgi:hypothetical protein